MIFALASMSCVNPLTASGSISEWRDAPPGAHSSVFLGGPGTIPASQLVALNGVEVQMQAEVGPATPEHGVHSFAQTTSGAGGHFSLRVFVGAGLPHARVTFRKPGFEPVDVETSETRLDQIVVALVREQS